MRRTGKGHGMQRYCIKEEKNTLQHALKPRVKGGGGGNEYVISMARTVAQ